MSSKDYPDHLELKLVQLFHRHGHRTPLKTRLNKHIPAYWRSCFESSPFLHQFLTFAVERRRNMEPESASLDSWNEPSLEHSASLDLNSDSISVQSPGLSFSLLYEENELKQPAASGICYLGQLTDTGRFRMRSLGAMLREKYIHKLQFLQPEFQKENFYLRSTEFARTIESVQCLVSGMFPNLKDPVELHVRKQEDEVMYPRDDCAALKKLQNEFKRKYLADYKERIDKIQNKLKNLFSIPDSKGKYPTIHGLYDSIYAAKQNLMPTSYISEEDFMELERLSAVEWFRVYRTEPQSCRLGIGRFLERVKKQLTLKIANTGQPLKMAIYSGHDNTLAPLLASFGVLDAEYWPPFASLVSLELLKENGSNQHHARLSLDDKFLKIPSCQSKFQEHPELCPVERFLEIIDNLLPSDYENECISKSK